eukprot:14072278-Alexandrium_andersonii.AAC.1
MICFHYTPREAAQAVARARAVTLVDGDNMWVLKTLHEEIDKAWAWTMAPPAPPAALAARPKWQPKKSTSCPSTPPRRGEARNWNQKQKAPAAAARPSPPEAAETMEQEAWSRP